MVRDVPQAQSPGPFCSHKQVGGKEDGAKRPTDESRQDFKQLRQQIEETCKKNGHKRGVNIWYARLWQLERVGTRMHMMMNSS